MPSQFDDAIDKMMAEYRSQLEQITENQRKIQAITGTATSQRKSVSVTLSAQGELVELKFPTDAYKEMAPAELAKVISETYAAAHAQVTQKRMELMRETAPMGVDIAALFRENSEPGKALPSNPVMTDAVREYVDNGRVPGVSDS